ncbi:uncharacterized protein LOC135160721 [Diachasmimorpha longicaudata]|uniref:uncharacterized protein LOC135160721 n=1 Tax=Diachasmimorpha longicaudata TaxID=58733 RepID=UPI0030B9154F
MALGCAYHRYVTLSFFIALGISGLVVCAAGSVFAYQFRHYGYQTIDIENLTVAPALLITLGLLTCPLALYFWWFFDHKYNRSQLAWFITLLIILTALESLTAILAIQKHKELVTTLTVSMEDSLKSSLHVPSPDWAFNHTEIKMNCCSSHETAEGNFTPWICCDFQRHEHAMRSSCQEVYGTKCRNLTINRYQSILFHVFLLALSSVTFQISVILELLWYVRKKKKQMAQGHLKHSIHFQR